MTKTDTIGRVARPRGVLSDQTKATLAAAKFLRDKYDREYRIRVRAALEEGSFSAVAEATGLSRDTLQRWKREAGK